MRWSSPLEPSFPCVLTGTTIIALVGLAALPCHAAPEMARSADGFVDSIGVGTHLTTTEGPYAPATIGQVNTLLGNLGVRHIRADVHNNSFFPSRLDTLYNNYGIRADMIGDRTWNVTTQVQIAVNDAAIESLEGLNEFDTQGARYTYISLGGTKYQDNPDTKSFPATQAFQRDLYNTVAGAKPVLSPTVAHLANTPYILPIPFDFISAHFYPNGRPPTGYSLDNFAIPASESMWTASTPPPLIVTETGYQTSSAAAGQAYVSEAAQAKYLLRTFTEYFNRGILRTYSYDLINDAPDDSLTPETDQESNFGLVDAAFRLKPAYTAEQNLINLLKEATWNPTQMKWTGASATFTPGFLDYTLTGGGPALHHTLLQKANGVFYLILWQEVCSFDTYKTKTDIANANVNVVLNVNTPIQRIDLYQPNNSASSSGTYTGQQSVTLSVPDQLLVVALTPAAGSAPWTDADIGAVGVAGSSKLVGGFIGGGVRGDYFSDKDLSDLSFQRVDPAVNFAWGSTAPDPSLGSADFSVRWTGQIVPEYTGSYTFNTQADAGVRLRVNGSEIISHWAGGAPGGNLTSSAITLTAGQKYDLALDTWDSHAGNWYYSRLYWQGPSTPNAIVPLASGWSVSGAGGNIWDAADAFHYTYQPLNGDGTFIVRVTDIGNTSGSAKAGIMVRQSLAAGSANACVALTPASGINFQYRTTANGSTTGTTQSGVTCPYWLKLTRAGNQFTAATSANGTTWTALGSAQTISMTGTVYVGLATCSRDTTRTTTGMMDSLAFSFPTVSIQATRPLASRSPSQAGVFTITRTGSTTAALSVSYSPSGTAINGTDYASLSGSVSIPAGSATATVSISPVNGVFPADTTAQLTLLPAAAYNLGRNSTDTVKIASANTLFAGNVLGNWTTQSQSQVSIQSQVPDNGSPTLKWLYTDNYDPNVPNSGYNNAIQYHFTAQDWSKVSKVRIRFATAASNAVSDAGQVVYCDLLTNSQRISGGYGAVDQTFNDGTTAFRTIELSLWNYPGMPAKSLANIDGLMFYVPGMGYLLGTHTWYIDSIVTQ